MLPLLVAVLSLTVFGLPLVVAVDRGARPLRLLGLAFLYGSGAMYLLMLVMSIVHVRWSLVNVVVAAIVVVAGVRGFEVSRFRGARAERLPRNLATSKPRTHLVTLPIDAATAITMLGYALFATIAPLWEWDFWAIWGLKARIFLERGGIDWRFLETRWNEFVHPDYPLLLTLNFDFAALASGGWSDRWLGILFVAWAVALLLVVRSLALEEAPPLAAALITFAVATIAASRFVGLAEGPLIAFAGAGVLFVRRALLYDDNVAWRHGAILLGFAASTKNEGLAMLASVALAVIASDVRRGGRVVRLWPAAAIVAPWLALRAIHKLPTDLAQGPIGARLMARLADAGGVLRLLERYLSEPWFWVSILAAIAFVPAALRRRERFVLLATAIQLLVYVATYFETPRDLQWHIMASWPRLTTQVSVPITVAVMVMLANSLAPAEDSPHAEARPEQQ